MSGLVVYRDGAYRAGRLAGYVDDSYLQRLIDIGDRVAEQQQMGDRTCSRSASTSRLLNLSIGIFFDSSRGGPVYEVLAGPGVHCWRGAREWAEELAQVMDEIAATYAPPGPPAGHDHDH